jgi:cyclopropane fatty-acyl-phospholipid synthase-like methyltransferase
MTRRPNASRARGAAALAFLAAALLLAGCDPLKRWAYEDFGGRDAWQQPERVVADLGLAEGARVADLGSGGGYFSFRLARAVGASGRVFAVDIDPGMNEHVAKEAEKQRLANLETVLAASGDPRLPEPVDLVFTSNTYHHLEDRAAYFRRVRERHLRPGGRVAIVEYRPEQSSHSTSRETIEAELSLAGFRLLQSFDYLEKQHFLVFTPATADPDEPPR